MSDIISFSDDCSGDSTDTTNWKYLIDIIKIVNRDLLDWSSWPVKNYVVIINFDRITLCINFFCSWCLRRLQFQKLLKILETWWKELLFENSRSDRKSTYISDVVFRKVFIHVFINPGCIDVVRKDGKFGWEDEILLLRCWERSVNWGRCGFSWKGIAKWIDHRSSPLGVDFVSDELSEHRVLYTFEINLIFVSFIKNLS